MKKLIMSMMLFGAGLFFLASCESQSRVDELKDFVEKVKSEGSEYTEKQWEAANEEFSELLEKLESYEDLSAEELKEMARLQGEYAATAFKNQSKDALEKAGAILDGFMEGLTGNDSEGNDSENKEKDNKE